jgi:S-adenosylmethionine hydrolase
VPVHLVPVTDCVDVAANELRGALLSAAAGADVVVEPFAPILPAFSAINGCLVMRLIADCYPAGTVLLSTMGPLKKRPLAVAGRTVRKDLRFIGRNTGVFDWLVRDFGCAELYDISGHYGKGREFVSFAGRSVTAPLAAQVARGAQLADLGPPLSAAAIVRLDLPAGTVVHVDNFGNLKFTGELPVVKEGARYLVKANGTEVNAVYAHRMMGRDDGEWVLFPGSSLGMFELGRVRAYGDLPVGVGDVLDLQPITWSGMRAPGYGEAAGRNHDRS